jgi:hypothetical protein
LSGIARIPRTKMRGRSRRLGIARRPTAARMTRKIAEERANRSVASVRPGRCSSVAFPIR